MVKEGDCENGDDDGEEDAFFEEAAVCEEFPAFEEEFADGSCADCKSY